MTSWGFASAFEAVARVHPQRLAVVHGETRRTWRDLDRRAGALAAALGAAGLGRGDVVAQYLRNGPAYVESFLAAAKAALVPMNTNFRYVDDELVQIWTDADVRAVVYGAEFRDSVDRVRDRVPGVLAWVEVAAEDPVDAETALGDPPAWVTSYDAALASPPVPHGGGDEDSLILLYTGGTTGRPKGVMWRQGDLLSLLNSQHRRPIPDRAPPDVVDAHLREHSTREVRFLTASPLMHGAGLFYAVSALAGGGTVVTVPGRSFSAEALLDAAARERVQSLAIVGDAFARPLLAALDAEPVRWDLASLRVVFSSGVMWSAEVKTRLLAHLPQARLLDGLGSSEASAVASTVSTAGDVGDTASFRPSERAAILLDDGTLARPGDGQVGRLAVTGWIPVGYLNDPEKSAATFVEAAGRRWSVPGDLARLDADGRVRLLGRGSGVINTGGEKVFAEEVEEVLKRHPAVADAAVLGIPDERFGRRVVALVELSPGVHEAPREADLVTHARGRLAGYKVPRHVAVVPSVGRGANGKLDHRRLTELAEKKWSNP